MLGTIANTIGIICGSFIGNFLGNGIPEKHKEALFQAMGFAALILGINASVTNMHESSYPVLFILSLAIGGLAGTCLDIDGRFMRLSARFGNSELGRGLSTAILLFCIGTLSILGPIESAVHGDNTFLFTNATLDFVTSIVLSSAYGLRIALAAPVLFCWQGSIYCLGCWAGPFLAHDLLAEMSVVGGILISASGLGILKIKDCKTLNMLPAIPAAIVLYYAAKAFLPL